MQLSQLYVSARDAPGESAARLWQLYLACGEKGSLLQLKPHFWCKSAFAGLRPFRRFSPETRVTFAHYPYTTPPCPGGAWMRRYSFDPALKRATFTSLRCSLRLQQGVAIS
eukprot:1837182-Prymnesium_polylepis.1